MKNINFSLKIFIIIFLFFINISFAFSIWIYDNPEYMTVEKLEVFISEKETELENHRKMILENPNNEKILWKVNAYERNIKIYNKILERKKDFRFRMEIIYYIFVVLCILIVVSFLVFLYNLYKVLFW